MNMDGLNADEAFLAFDPSYDPNNNRLYPMSMQTWPLPVDQNMPHQQQQQQQQQPSKYDGQIQQRANTSSATSRPAATAASLQANRIGYSQAGIDPSATGLLTDWSNYHLPLSNQQTYLQNGNVGIDPSTFNTYGGSLQTSPTEFNMPVSQAAINASLAMDNTSNYMTMPATMDMNGAMNGAMNMAPFQMQDFQQELMTYAGNDGMGVPSSVGGSSPGENWMDVRSLSGSDNGWSNVECPPQRRSFDSFNTDQSNAIIFNPSQNLHIRTESNGSSQGSDVPVSAASFSSYEEVFPMNSPRSENALELNQQPAQNMPNVSMAPDMKPPDYHNHYEHQQHSQHQHFHAHPHSNCSSHNNSPKTASVSPAALVIEPQPIPVEQAQPGSSPSTSSASSPPSSRRKKSPAGAKDKVQKTIQKKQPAHTTKKDVVTEKRVGRRRGPLRPDQRQQAHEIRKLRACLRCKFLKKTCDKGDPCGGCQPSHARLWQVPCTRIDIKDIAYFMKDWKADYERHVSLGFSVGNIKGFSQIERQIYITHGYGFYLPINAREVYVRDDKCFGIDWVESKHETPKEFVLETAKLSAGMEGISRGMLSEYLDRHIDGGFERFVDEYFEGTWFITETLKTVYRYYLREKLPVIRKALKLVLAYNLTLHVTMVEGLGEEDQHVGKVDEATSKFFGKTVAPVMINFQVKCALADMWRELQKDVLEELSSLYSSVYSGDKLKNWPTIFMLAAVLLCVWELMQFDCHYRTLDNQAVEKFCNDMESTPVGVIVGLFQAISQKLPSFSEWDTRKHHHLLASNPAVCDAMTEVRAHVHKYDAYLRSRTETKFDRQDFDSLSNKFISKLVIRAN